MTCDAFHRAYFAPPIASLMAAFQEGLHFYMLAMVNLQLPPHLVRNVYPNAAFARLAAVMDPSLDEYGSSRLSRLFACLDEMHAIMLLHATYSGRVDVVEVALKHRGVTPAMMLLLIDVAAWKNQRGVLDFFRQHPHASGWACLPFALVAAAREGHLDIVRFLHEHFPTVPSTEDAMDMAAEEGCTEQAMDWACEHGHLDVAQWLVEHRSKEGFTEKAFDLAAGNSHMAVVEFLHRLQALEKEKAIDLAAGNGHLSMVQWLHQHRPLQGCTEVAMDKAAANGHLDVVEWLHENRSEGGTTAGFCGAAGGGHLDVLKWLVANRADEFCTKKALQAATEQIRVEVVEWLLNQDHDMPKRVVVMADNTSGCIDMIQLLQQHHPKIFVDGGFVCAVRGGDLNFMKWMFNRGEYDASALDEAASYGHLHVVQWLHARSFPATTYAMDYACKNGHLHVVRWLHRHRDEGCTSFAMSIAIQNGHFSVVQWLHRHGLQDISDVDMEYHARSGDVTLVEYLHMHHEDATITFNISGAFSGGHFSVVQFLHRHRPDDLSTRGLDSAVWCGHLQLAKWLVASTEASITDDTLWAAVKSGDLTMLKWVLSHWTGDFDSLPVICAAENGQLSLIQCLWESGFEWTDECAVDSAAASGHLAVLVALHAHGVPLTNNAMYAAAVNGDVQVVRWLHTNGYSGGCALSAMEAAVGMRKVAMVAFLHNEVCPASGKTLLKAVKHDAVRVVKWLVTHGEVCMADAMAWAEQHPNSTSAKWLLAHPSSRAESSGSDGPKRRKVSHERHTTDGRVDEDN